MQRKSVGIMRFKIYLTFLYHYFKSILCFKSGSKELATGNPSSS